MSPPLRDLPSYARGKKRPDPGRPLQKEPSSAVWGDWSWSEALSTSRQRIHGRPAVVPQTAAAMAPARSGRCSRRRHRSRRFRQVRALVLVIVFGLFVAAFSSYVGALTAPGSASAGMRTVEWVSNKVPGGRAVVLWAERVWYTWHAPPKGGTPAGGLPQVASVATSGQVTADTMARVHLPSPPSIAPITTDPLPGEGQWHSAGRLVAGFPAVRVTYLRPDAVHTSLVTGVMWLDMKLLQAELVPGTQVPSAHASWPGVHYSIPAPDRGALAATFNSGFLLRDSGGGWYGEGRLAAPLVEGGAALVIYKGGTATVAQWGRDAKMSSDVAAVRQNLRLIVDGGQVVPEVGTDNYRLWGKTLGNTMLVWRSGAGVTKDGALVYAAGNGLSVQSLAEVLQRAGAVRAMELDINKDWTSANYYEAAPGSAQVVSPTKLLPDMHRPATRFLVPDERDFFALFVRPELLSGS
jgi:hypothetical protein